MTYNTTDTELFVTDAYTDDAPNITASADVGNTPQYSEEIVLTNWDSGCNIDITYIEINGTTGTDKVLIDVLRARKSSLTAAEKGKMTSVKLFELVNSGVAAGEKIKNIVINDGPGTYVLKIYSSGSTNTFDVLGLGRKF